MHRAASLSWLSIVLLVLLLPGLAWGQYIQEDQGASNDAFALRISFNGIDSEPVGITFSPDAAIGAGPEVLVLARNHRITIMTKTGTVVDTKQMPDFFAPVSAFYKGDPYILFDPGSSRFFVVAEAHNHNTPNCAPGACISQYLLAVSKTANPKTLTSADWYLYALDRTLDLTLNGPRVTTNWGDFDKLAVAGNALIITSIMFSFKDESPQGVKIRILDKSLLISGAPVTTWTDFVELKNPFNGALISVVLPATRFDGEDTVFLVTGCGGIIFGITNALTAPTLTTRTVETGGACNTLPPDAAQPGAGTALDVVAFNTPPVYRNGHLWVADVIPKDFGSGNVSAIRWAEIDVSNWPDSVSLVQEGILGADSVWHFAPAIMVDALGNLAMVYARSSPTEFASAYYTGRLATDPPNTLRPGRLLKAGTATLNLIDRTGRNRFTDYFGIALDPIDESFWMMGMYAKASTASGTWVGNVIPVTQPAGIMAAFESPEAGPVSGISVIRGWAFATQAGVSITKVELFIDGVRVGNIPCCSERADVQAAFPQFPAANTLNSGWGTTFNWGLLSSGTHTVRVEIRSTAGELFSTETRTVTVVRPGGFEFLDRFDLSGALARIEGDELIVEGIVVRDKATQRQKEIDARFRWFTSSQSLGMVEAMTIAETSSLRSRFSSLFASLSARLLGLSAAASAQAAPGIMATFESPEYGQAVSGVAVIRGWAFADRAGASLTEVRLVIDGQPGGNIPCCSARGDVDVAFPGNPNALNSGWGATFNYGLLSSGFHTIGVQIRDSTGASFSDSHRVTVVRIGGFEFLDQFDLAGATARIEGEEIVLTGVMVRDKATRQTRVVTVRLRWLQSSQALGIVSSAG